MLPSSRYTQSTDRINQKSQIIHNISITDITMVRFGFFDTEKEPTEPGNDFETRRRIGYMIWNS